MKNLLLATIVLCSSGGAFAASPAERLHSKLEPAVMSMKGVVGIGITGCDPYSGRPTTNGNYVECVLIYAKTQNAANALIRLYPAGKKIDGIFVTIDLSGEVVIHPRISGGN